jgi:hypothetical protein
VLTVFARFGAFTMSGLLSSHKNSPEDRGTESVLGQSDDAIVAGGCAAVAQRASSPDRRCTVAGGVLT